MGRIHAVLLLLFSRRAASEMAQRVERIVTTAVALETRPPYDFTKERRLPLKATASQSIRSR